MMPPPLPHPLDQFTTRRHGNHDGANHLEGKPISGKNDSQATCSDGSRSDEDESNDHSINPVSSSAVTPILDRQKRHRQSDLLSSLHLGSKENSKSDSTHHNVASTNPNHQIINHEKEQQHQQDHQNEGKDETIQHQRCYTELGIRNIAALFICLSDDVARQKRKSQKHSINMLNLLISRQIQRRKVEALLSWRISTLSPALLKVSSSSKQLKSQQSMKEQEERTKDGKQLSSLSSSKSGEMQFNNDRVTPLISNSITSITGPPASTTTPTLNHVNLVVESLSARTSNLTQLFDRFHATLIDADQFWNVGVQ